MKHASLTTLVSFFVLLFFETGVTSCKKDTVINSQDTAISLQLITSNSWKMQEIRGVQGNNLTYYLRGGSSNTENLDSEYITFSLDKSGIYFDGNNASHQLTWDFTNNSNTQITFNIQNPSPLASQTVIYDNIRYKNRLLQFDQYWTYGNVNAHAQVIRSPK